MDQLLNLEEAAGYLRVSKTSLRRWTNDGRLPCVRVGRRGERRFRISDLDRFLQGAPAPAAGLHYTLLYRDPVEQWRALRPHLAAHLERGAPVVYAHDEGGRGRVTRWIRSLGYDPEGPLVRLLGPEEAYLRRRPFVAECMVDFMEACILGIRADGHRSMLITGETIWALESPQLQAQCTAYEALVHPMLERYPEVTALCQYDLARSPGEFVLGALCTHPRVLLGDRVLPGYLSA